MGRPVQPLGHAMRVEVGHSPTPSSSSGFLCFTRAVAVFCPSVDGKPLTQAHAQCTWSPSSDPCHVFYPTIYLRSLVPVRTSRCSTSDALRARILLTMTFLYVWSQGEQKESKLTS